MKLLVLGLIVNMFLVSGCCIPRDEMRVVNNMKSRSITIAACPIESNIFSRILYRCFWGMGISPCKPQLGEARLFTIHPGEEITVKDFLVEIKAPMLLANALNERIPIFLCDELIFLQDDESIWVQTISNGKTDKNFYEDGDLFSFMKIDFSTKTFTLENYCHEPTNGETESGPFPIPGEEK